MANPQISIFPKISVTTSTDTTPVDLFLDNIRDGKWQDLVLPIRAIKDKEERQRRKKLVPYVTISGIFPERKDNGCKQHSGLLGVDIDDVGQRTEEYRALLGNDPYCYAIFTSISGQGLCMLVKIDGEKHREAFAGFADYLISKYQIVVDPTSVNPSRPRYVSYDPHLLHNPKSSPFKQYPKKQVNRKDPAVVFVQSEFTDLLKRMVEAQVNCTDNYMDWLRVAYALADKLGEQGRPYFHDLSALSGKYDYETCDKQYTLCSRGSASDKRATIGTIYWFAKQAGLDISSPLTKKIASATTSIKRSGGTVESIIETLQKFEDIDPMISRPIVEEAFASNADFSKEETAIEAIRTWLRNSFDFRRNIITGRVEVAGRPMVDTDYNTIFIEAKILFKELTFELFTRILNSANIPQYNPFLEFYAANRTYPYNNEIGRLWASIQCDNDERLQYFGTKWLVSIISSIHGIHSPLMLVLAGRKQNTGKTEWFRRLLPKEWQQYYAESKLDAGKDDELLMTQKLLVVDDEMGGKSKKESKRLKELTSKQTFSLRRPYGHSNEDINRLAVLGGTSNELDLLNDPTGNRRIIPIEVLGIDHAIYNSVNKTALFIQLFRMYEEGFEWQFSSADVAQLTGTTEQFMEYSQEYEMIQKFYLPGPEGSQGVQEMTATEIKIDLETKTNQKISLRKLGLELTHLKFEKRIKRRAEGTAQVYFVRDASAHNGPKYTPIEPNEPDLW